MPALDFEPFRSLHLPGGFILMSVETVDAPFVDAIGRPALARTVIQGAEIRITLAAGQSVAAQSISLYHELLEALTVAWPVPPAVVMEFCEADFEREARLAHDRWGVATPASVLAFLATFDFR